MKILVPVKQVALLDEDFELESGSTEVEADWLEYELNEWDGFSLEAALEIRDAGADAEVIAVSVGDDGAEEALLACLAKGADRAIRVGLDSASPDVLTVARLLSLVAERESPDLVFCGVQSADAVNGATGVALAGYAGLRHVAVVRSIQWDGAQSTLTLGRELEGGLIEQLRVAAPALLTIQTGINEPRYANLRAIKMAREKPMEVISAADLGVEDLDAVAGARVVELIAPSSDSKAEMLDGDADSVAERIAAIIKDAGVTA